MGKKYDIEVEEKVEKIIELLTNEVSKAESKYKRDKNRLIHKANAKEYELHELNEMYKTISDLNQASKEMYTTYEIIIMSLNDQCLIYENEGMSHSNLVHIVDFLEKICKSYGQLTDSISVRVDYGNRMDAGNIDFTPSVVALGIKKAWELKLSLHQESDEEKEHRAIIRAEEEKRWQKLQAERDLKEAKLREQRQIKVEEEKKKKEKEEEKLKNKVAEWEKEVVRIKREKEEKLASITKENENKYTKLRCTMEKNHATIMEEKNDLIDSANNRKNELQLQLEQAGVFKFSLKRLLKGEIQTLENRIEIYEQEREQLERIYQQKMAESYADERDALRKEKNQIEMKYIIPENPKDAYVRKQEEERAKKEKQEKEKIAKEKAERERAELYPLLSVIKEYSSSGCLVSDILRDPAFSDYSAQRISALLLKAKKLGLVYSVSSGGKGLFYVK